jgi:rhodanese-related sulfurtransferase
MGPGSEDFADRVAKLDKGKPYLVHCAVGGRSATATRKMQKLGFLNLSDFSGGMEEWKESGKPIEKGQDAKPSDAK